MDRKAILTADDDPHGKPIEEGEGQSLPFALEGVNYEIDLNDENAPKLPGRLRAVHREGPPERSRDDREDSYAPLTRIPPERRA
ncbi:Lsr2 dimerization domain-containing protein [Clavibacter michiganensis]|uniref:Lsr2 dimerization domain-containing protein n=1 Tax=Clavibacter michiganensis TaxID=28447 RepID=UPI00345C57AE